MNNTVNASDVLKTNPLMKYAIVTYSYIQEYGSDGCWSSIAHGTCTLSEWVSGSFHNRHGGNRSYDFSLDSIEDASIEVLNERAATAKKEADERARKQFAANIARKTAQDALKARIEACVGITVTVKKKEGTVERAMESRYDAGRIAMLVRFSDGSKKWHSEGAVKRK